MRADWTETTLGELVDIQKGKKPPVLGDSTTTGQPYLTADVLRGGAPSQFVPQSELTTCVHLQGNETILLWDGAGAGDVFRSTAGVLASTMAKLAIKPISPISAEYLYLVVMNASPDIKSSCRGTTVPHVSPGALAAISLRLPPLPEQNRIVDVIGTVDVYISSLQQQAAEARKARNAVLHELLTAGGEDWVEVTLEKLLSQSVGGVWGSDPDTDQEEVTVVRSTEFSKSGILRYKTGVARSIKSSQLSTRELSAGDILLEKSGGGPDQPVGRVVYVSADIPPRFVCSNFIQLLRPKTSEVHPKFLFLVMWMWHLQNRTLEYQAQTTGIRNLRTPDYLEQTLKLPPQADQHQIVETVSAMDDVISSTEQAISDAKELRSGLLSDLLSGDHEIPESYDYLLGVA